MINTANPSFSSPFDLLIARYDDILNHRDLISFIRSQHPFRSDIRTELITAIDCDLDDADLDPDSLDPDLIEQCADLILPLIYRIIA